MNSSDLFSKLNDLQSQHAQICSVADLLYKTFQDDGAYTTNTSVRYMTIPSKSNVQLGVLLTGGIQGNELIGPEALLSFADTYLNCIAGYVQGTEQLPTRLILGNNALTFGAGQLKWIADHLSLYIVPLVNPDGRDYSIKKGDTELFAGRKNRHRAVGPNETPATDDGASMRGVNINRNFDIVWNFEKKFAGDLQSSMREEINTGGQDYRGAAPESEPETKNIVDLVDSYRRKITFLFDIHGQNADSNDITYPWGWCNNQMKYADQCFGNPQYDGNGRQPRPGQVLRTGKYYSQYDTNEKAQYDEGNPPQSKYGEYMAKDWLLGEMGLQSIALQFQSAASALSGTVWNIQQSPAGPPPKTPPPAGLGVGVSGLYIYSGSIDDWFFSLDRDHMRALTIECQDLKPNETTVKRELQEITAGVLGALQYIGRKLQASIATGASSPDPLQRFRRFDPSTSRCPP